MSDIINRASAHLAYITREPQKWWDDEHCLDNGQSAAIIDRLMGELIVAQSERDAALDGERRAVQLLHGYEAQKGES